MELSESKYAVAYKQEMKKIFSIDEVNLLWKDAEHLFQKLLEKYPRQPESVAKHTYISIFPAIAIYKTVLAAYPDQAMQIMEQGAASLSKRRGAQYAKMVKLPGFKGIFIKIFSKGLKTGFGAEAGFSYEMLTDTRKELAFNMTKCPYAAYCKQYGCEELVHVFCKNDEYAYGNLPGLDFIRTQTLGTGGTCCDFKLRRHTNK